MKYTNKRNPILPLSVHVPDVEAHVMPDGKLYLYGSFDNQEDFYCSEKYHVVSTPDMEHWTMHDVSLEGKDIPWFDDPKAPKYPGLDWLHPTPFLMKMIGGMDIEAAQKKMESEKNEKKPPLLFAPDAIYKDGKYYLYFCMSDDSEGVAISDKPEGPFKNPIQLPCGGIDPAIFIDDDGSAYYYWGQVFGKGVRLNDDMVSFNTEDIVDNLITEEEHHFHEGSSIRKIGDTYYMVYSNVERGKPTSLGYSASKSPLGPFTYRGILIDNEACDPKSWNNHGSIECVDGQWYIFYHRSSRDTQQHRRLCIEPISINSDGSIDEVLMTSQGIGEPFGLGEKIMGYQACGLKGSAYIDVDEEYEEVLTSIEPGDEVVFRYVESKKPFTEIEIEARGSATISVLLNDVKVGSVVIEEGIMTKSELKENPGKYELKLVIEEAKKLQIIGVKL